MSVSPHAPRARSIPNLRWWIVALLFCSSVLNYIDRQTLSILATTIQRDLGISDIGYAQVVQAFLLAYTVTFLFAGRLTDYLGTRASLTLFVVWWSAANVLTAFAASAFSLGFFRLLLGIGEPGNWTAAPKAVSEWFTDKERGLAIGIYTTGATVGATLAPPLIAYLAVATPYGWRAAFVITGLLGFLFAAVWYRLYRLPHEHPLITDAELAVVPPALAAGRVDVPPGAANVLTQEAELPPTEGALWRGLLARRETWLLLVCRMLTDPVWYFYLFWFPKYLQDARGLTLAEVGQVAWVVYLAADVGAITGGWASGRMIRRGVGVVRARKTVMTVAALLLPLSPLVAQTPSVYLALALASVAALAHLAWQVTLGVLVVDLFPRRSVATVFGLIAAGSGFGGFVSTVIIGQLVTNYSYAPVFALMGVLHPLALVLLWLVRSDQPAAETKPVHA